jgi:hypothetical protein
VLPLVAAQGGLRLRAEAHALLARALLTAADAETLRAGGADWCTCLCYSLLCCVSCAWMEVWHVSSCPGACAR